MSKYSSNLSKVKNPVAYATILWATFEQRLVQNSHLPNLKREMLRELHANKVQYYDVTDEFWVNTKPSDLSSPVYVLVYEHQSEMKNRLHSITNEHNLKTLTDMVNTNLDGNFTTWKEEAAKVDYYALMNDDMLKTAVKNSIKMRNRHSNLRIPDKENPDILAEMLHQRLLYSQHYTDVRRIRDSYYTPHNDADEMDAYYTMDKIHNPMMIPKAHLSEVLLINANSNAHIGRRKETKSDA